MGATRGFHDGKDDEAGNVAETYEHKDDFKKLLWLHRFDRCRD
jgi:hypothetical protein